MRKETAQCFLFHYTLYSNLRGHENDYQLPLSSRHEQIHQKLIIVPELPESVPWQGRRSSSPQIPGIETHHHLSLEREY